MDYKKANWAFLFMIATTFAMVLIFSVLSGFGNVRIGLVASNVFSEAAAFLPAAIVVLFSGESLWEAMNFKKIRFSSALLTVLFVILLYPSVTLISATSMFFVENTIAEISPTIVSLPMWEMLLFIGILGPLTEEIVFRGFMLGSYRKSGRILGSMVLSSVIFGIIHLNFSQFLYGAFMGFMFAMLFEATGSILSTFLAHGLFNSYEVLLMYSVSDSLENSDRLSADMLGQGGLGVYLAGLAAIGILCLIFAFLVVKLIAGLEGRQTPFNAIRNGQKQGYKLVTLPAAGAFVLAVVFMVGVEFISRF